MDATNHEAAELCRLELDQAEDLLADIKVGRTRHRYGAAEIAAIEAKRERLQAELSAFEASRDP